ncbi:cytidylyltransferase domain-containing protein [Helicobacter cetorum]|uniref:N-acylneuraminate cytidylyltransferase n=1 Tax=Helicobacter cetorum (strain ATCC BAA-429 / MIT 00-7128) TaxID=182217 RepID=I0EP48_HELC0|nr:acylneuraminate cytidylyltransferase family protein [Helicobacter cetorum]AFI04717.1 N-acylneuraminate cytidylyltransferase [Helicobacter cetorum MIT 00-7128]
MKVLAYIPARSGSKGVKDKNIKAFRGLPLMAHTILSALNSKLFDEVMVSTDNEVYKEIALKYGASVPFLRSQENSSDTAPTILGLLETLENYSKINMHFNHVMILQPTSPLRDTKDILGAWECYAKNHFQSLASVHKVEINPFLLRTLKDDQLSSLLRANSTIRRQDIPHFYQVNGAIYLSQTSELDEKTSLNDSLIGYEIAISHALDIDNLKDFNE